jgi:Glu-tRNA(Gln) amidotransferase subunit E-like FAD-binding protein
MKVIKHKDKWYLQSETGYKEILLSTDDLLIKDGVQAIDDEFLEWFVKNPSCEVVEVEQEILKLVHNPNYVNHTPEGDGIYLTPKSENLQYRETLIEDNVIDYKIIIPSEEPKQETIENKFKSLVTKWQQQQINYETLAEHYIYDQHNNRKFTYKAIATRDCWKELLMLLNSHKDEK